jgi:hypothetical protein
MHRSQSMADAQHLLPFDLQLKNNTNLNPPVSIANDKMMRKVASTSKILGTFLETLKDDPDFSKKSYSTLICITH